MHWKFSNIRFYFIFILFFKVVIFVIFVTLKSSSFYIDFVTKTIRDNCLIIYYNCKNFNVCVMWTFQNIKRHLFTLLFCNRWCFVCMWVLMLFSFVFSSTCNYKCQSSIVLLIFCLTFVYFVSFAHLHITTFHCILLQLHVFWWFFV